MASALFTALAPITLYAQQAATDNPPIPLLTPAPNAVRVALIDSGVNYQLAEIARGLAADADGKLIGYDFWDMDELPFDFHPLRDGRVFHHGTKTASIVLREAPHARLVPYRYPRPDMSRMRALITHAAENNVRVIGMPLGSNKEVLWDMFAEVAPQFPDILFIASAGNNGRNIDSEPVYPASLDTTNMLVVTSADDFVRPAEGVNWGRTSVDYMVPAERQPVIEFNGSDGLASGSSYAVPRIVALAARVLEQNPEFNASDIQHWLKQRFANGAAPKQIGLGYIGDPQIDPAFDSKTHIRIDVERVLDWTDGLSVIGADNTAGIADGDIKADASAGADRNTMDALQVPMDVLVIDEHWSYEIVESLVQFATTVYKQCNIAFSPVRVVRASVPDYLRDLETGASRTLMDALRASGPSKKLTVVLARDTRMNIAFDGEAFGRANTRSRPWLTDSVWLTNVVAHSEIALAHELFHVLANAGGHDDREGNLMLSRTTGNNITLDANQCEAATKAATRNGLARN